MITQMRVTLIDYTGKGSPNQEWRAADIMMFTKNTRLHMGPGTMYEVERWPVERKLEQLALMANTNPGSWEFSDYTFLLENVSRALTHQLVRTRTASYAQQTQQVLDVSGFEYVTGPSVSGFELRRRAYEEVMNKIDAAYRYLIKDGARIEDARGVLPTNICTNIAVKMNMRTLVTFLSQRTSPRNLGEIRTLTIAMRAAVMEVHPWMHLFLERTKDRACSDLDAGIGALSGVPQEERTRLLKLVDQLRAS